MGLMDSLIGAATNAAMGSLSGNNNSAQAAGGSGGLGGVMAFETIGVEDVLAEGQNAAGRARTGYRSANEQWSANLTTAARARP